MKRVMIIACGSKKKDGKHRAKDLYTGTFFVVHKKYAERFFDDWLIFSGKYGLIHPDKKIKTYEAIASGPPANIDILDEYDQIYFLGSKKYHSFLPERTVHLLSDIPLMGYRLHILLKAVKKGKEVDKLNLKKILKKLKKATKK